MTTQVFDTAFILTAGHGTRMRPLTDHTPKPMATIGGETLIKRIIGQCRAAGVTNLFANAHHLADRLTDHIGQDVTILYEDELLNTGLGIKKLLPHIKNEPFFVISGDSWWRDKGTSVFDQMTRAWDDDRHDLLLVLQPIDTMSVTEGIGDYHLDGATPRRALDQKGTHMFTSLRLCHPRLFDESPDTPFSFLDLMDKAQREGRLGAIVLDGTWHHLSTMADLDAVENWLTL